jgi:hypothetical protein
MSTIKITDLFPIGLDLLSDSESYITALDDESLLILKGGIMTIGQGSSTYVCSDCMCMGRSSIEDVAI